MAVARRYQLIGNEPSLVHPERSKADREAFIAFIMAVGPKHPVCVMYSGPPLINSARSWANDPARELT
jgi:hypothetical protein